MRGVTECIVTYLISNAWSPEVMSYQSKMKTKMYQITGKSLIQCSWHTSLYLLFYFLLEEVWKMRLNELVRPECKRRHSCQYAEHTELCLKQNEA